MTMQFLEPLPQRRILRIALDRTWLRRGRWRILLLNHKPRLRHDEGCALALGRLLLRLGLALSGLSLREPSKRTRWISQQIGQRLGFYLLAACQGAVPANRPARCASQHNEIEVHQKV